MTLLTQAVARSENFNIDSVVPSQTDTDMVENFSQKKVQIRTAHALGTNAAKLKFYPGSNEGKTTVNTAAVATDTIVIIDTTDVAGTEVNGRTITNNDFLIVELDERNSKQRIYQLLDISGNAPDAGNSKNSLTVVAFDGGAGLEKAVSVANIAYIVSVESVPTIAIDATAQVLEFVFVGKNGHPVGVSIDEGAGGTTHRVNGVAQYIE